ncbi:hypothetical protein K474DRAFT_1653820 [Panus rudis PR-1116 ss-1]|nr:hypothetical protein K474DRAFT_1653820 [Panus rudis PR-1116 ss-1]
MSALLFRLRIVPTRRSETHSEPNILVAQESMPSESLSLPSFAVIDLPSSDHAETPAERYARRKARREEARELAKREDPRVTGNYARQTTTPKPYPEVTIYSHPQGPSGPQPAIPLQEAYVGSKPVISSLQASRPCSAEGVDGLLRFFNSVLATEYTFSSQPGLQDHLQECIDRKYDLGTALARLRPWWQDDFRQLQTLLDELHKEDDEMRRSALDTAKGQIVKPRIRPRRVWDLYSNRVLPIWLTRRDYWAVSHSWMDIRRRQLEKTPINAYEWPVPIPDDSTLDRVRVELLNLGAEYVWLDVLCLRQESDDPTREALRLEEWKLDVPTIGNVYHQNQMIVHYYSGLGRPFRIRPGDLDSERHWINRAWTVQETSSNSITAGVADDSPVGGEALRVDSNGEFQDPDIRRFHNTLSLLIQYSQDLDTVFPILDAMRHRAAVNELDKIAGLSYLLQSPTLPPYIIEQDPEDAWLRLLQTMNGKYRGDLLFSFPTPGDGQCVWAPSWQQIKDAPVLRHRGGVGLHENVQHVMPEDVYRSSGYRIDGCRIEGLSTHTLSHSKHSKYRSGKLLVTRNGDFKLSFEVKALHSHLIPEDEYVVFGSRGFTHWVVGKTQILPAGERIVKVSAVEMAMEMDITSIKELALARWETVEWA